MPHIPDFIQDLGFILITAAVVTLLCRHLKQPVVLGYIIAGILVGPHVPFTPHVSDVESTKTWAEIGVIFLLFALGLEFSFKKLARVGRSATVTAVFEVVFMLGLGYFCGQLFGWSTMDSLFLGGILSISSTTIIVRAFDELGLKTRRFVALVFGVLVVEDLIAILILVLLSTVAATQTLSGGELIFTVFKLLFFLLLWFILGLYFIPLFLRKVRSLLTDETTLIVSLGLCLFMVMLAVKAKFSPALGAFVMGSILAETREGKTIEKLIVPVKNLFAAIFFVSVGMLFDPSVVMENFGLVLTVTIVTIVGKFVSSLIGALLGGQSLKHAVQAGMSLAQIGEFSFIIATLGTSLKVTSDFLYPIAVAVSVLTTFTTPYQIRFADRFYDWLEKKIPQATLIRLNGYQTAVHSRGGLGIGTLVWRVYGQKILLSGVVIVAITFAVRKIFMPMAVDLVGDHGLLRIGFCLLTLICSAPFFWPIAFSAPSDSALRVINDVRRFRALQVGIVLMRLLISIVLVGFVVGQFFSLAAASGLVVLGSACLLMLLGQHTGRLYLFFEKKFLSNLKDGNEADSGGASPRKELAPWDATLADFVLSPDSDLIAKTLLDSRLRERFGVTVTMIERGQRRMIAPSSAELLLPGDRLFLVGEDQQLEHARVAIEGHPSVRPSTQDPEAFGLDAIVIQRNSHFKDKSIRECGLRERVNGLIVGVERAGRRILSPDASMELWEGDVVWVVGDRDLIRKIK